jgi:hypothetical protein
MAPESFPRIQGFSFVLEKELTNMLNLAKSSLGFGCFFRIPAMFYLDQREPASSEYTDGRDPWNFFIQRNCPYLLFK